MMKMTTTTTKTTTMTMTMTTTTTTTTTVDNRRNKTVATAATFAAKLATYVTGPRNILT